MSIREEGEIGRGPLCVCDDYTQDCLTAQQHEVTPAVISLTVYGAGQALGNGGAFYSSLRMATARLPASGEQL